MTLYDSNLVRNTGVSKGESVENPYCFIVYRSAAGERSFCLFLGVCRFFAVFFCKELDSGEKRKKKKARNFV